MWSKAERDLHINVLEMRAARLALTLFTRVLQGRSVLMTTDFTSVMAYINQQGGTRSWDLMLEVRRLVQIVMDLDMVL